MAAKLLPTGQGTAAVPPQLPSHTHVYSVHPASRFDSLLAAPEAMEPGALQSAPETMEEGALKSPRNQVTRRLGSESAPAHGARTERPALVAQPRARGAPARRRLRPRQP